MSYGGFQLGYIAGMQIFRFVFILFMVSLVSSRVRPFSGKFHIFWATSTVGLRQKFMLLSKLSLSEKQYCGYDIPKAMTLVKAPFFSYSFRTADVVMPSILFMYSSPSVTLSSRPHTSNFMNFHTFSYFYLGSVVISTGRVRDPQRSSMQQSSLNDRSMIPYAFSKLHSLSKSLAPKYSQKNLKAAPSINRLVPSLSTHALILAISCCSLTRPSQIQSLFVPALTKYTLRSGLALTYLVMVASLARNAVSRVTSSLSLLTGDNGYSLASVSGSLFGRLRSICTGIVTVGASPESSLGLIFMVSKPYFYIYVGDYPTETQYGR